VAARDGTESVAGHDMAGRKPRQRPRCGPRPFTIVPTIKVTRDNLAEAWEASLHEEAPSEILEAAEG
jgi:hypothetical protein